MKKLLVVLLVLGAVFTMSASFMQCQIDPEDWNGRVFTAHYQKVTLNKDLTSTITKWDLRLKPSDYRLMGIIQQCYARDMHTIYALP